MSLLLGQTVTRVTAEYPNVTAEQIAVVFSLMTGSIAMFIGLVRLGILVDLIPGKWCIILFHLHGCIFLNREKINAGPAIAGFMTGSAITITIGQWPKLFGKYTGTSMQDL